MKRLTVCFSVLLAVTGAALAQPSNEFQNLGNFQSPPLSPPQIDATTFDNEGVFNIGFNNFALANTIGNGGFFFTTSLQAFDFSDVLYFTNRGTMSCDTGFTFDFAPSTNGFRRMAASFGNGNSGAILAGSANSPFTTNSVFFAANIFGVITGIPVMTVRATNVVNSGLLDVGAAGLLTMTGNNLDLHRGTMHVEGFDDTNVILVLGTFGTFNTATLGVFADYEGIGRQTNQLSVANFTLPSPFSPLNNVTNTASVPTFSLVAPPRATAFINIRGSPAVSNVTFQVVFINTNLPGISTDVRFLPGSVDFATPIIQWESIITNNLGAIGNTVTTNDLYLADEFGSFPTNFIVTNGFSLSGVPALAPYNYFYFRSFPGYTTVPHGNAVYDATIFNRAFPATNAYAAYGVTLAPVTTFPDPTLPGSTFTNTAGRIEIEAETRLDLTSAKLTGPNYLKLLSTNHFVGSDNAQIISPYMDINLGTTNGFMKVTNLVAPTVPRFSGPIDAWSGRWTNVVGGVTNTFHVLIVNAQLSPTSLPIVLNCALRSTNIVLSDAINVNNTLLVNANNFTVSYNGSNAPTPYGQINELSSDILWSSSFPTLQNLTNAGLITAQNSIYFLGARQNPYYPTNFTEPYQSVVNHGLVLSSGISVLANYVENTGAGVVISNSPVSSTSGVAFVQTVATTTNQGAQMISEVGPITVNAVTALLANGGFDAAAGDMTIGANTLTVTNHFLLTSGALTLSVTNAMTDGGVTSNSWSVGDGMNLLVKPATGDLLGTTITNTCPAGLEVINTWAGNDRGAVNAGFVNNAAVGHLILDGGDAASTFFFGGPDNVNSYALYVDQIELRNGATNRVAINGIQQFTAFDIAPNMKIYFADAIIPGGVDISEKLNQANGGHLVWIQSFQGPFNSTNSASAQPNVIPGSGVKLSMSAAAQSHSPVIKWTAPANSTNYLYYTTNLASKNWQLVTNFLQGPASAAVSITDQGRTNSAGFYKVQVYPHQ